MEKSLNPTRERYGWAGHVPHWLTYLNPSVLKLLRTYDAHKVLDAGCGNGVMAGYLAEHGIDMTGMDADAEGIALAQTSFPSVRFEVGSFDVPPDAQYDAVVSTEVVEHLYAPEVLIRYCFEALRPGGVVIISTPYHGFWKNLAIVLIPGEWDRHHSSLSTGGHIKFWSRKTLTSLVEGGGFEVVEFAGSGRLPYIWKSMILVGRKPAA